MDYDRGDDVLQICQINMASALRYLSKIVEPQSAPWLAERMVIFTLRSAAPPVAQRFAADQPWGTLRARGSA